MRSEKGRRILMCWRLWCNTFIFSIFNGRLFNNFPFLSYTFLAPLMARLFFINNSLTITLFRFTFFTNTSFLTFDLLWFELLFPAKAVVTKIMLNNMVAIVFIVLRFCCSLLIDANNIPQIVIHSQLVS